MNRTTTMKINPKLLQPSPELMEIQKIMPIDKEDRKRLYDDIIKNGIRDAIKVYQTIDGEFKILGGLNRWDIAIDENIEIVPIDIYNGTHDEYRQLVRDDNLSRRHLTDKQKRKLIQFELSKTPEKSNRQIAVETKTHHATVAKVRANKEKSGEVKVQLKTVGKDGVARTTKPKRKSANEIFEKETKDIPKGKKIAELTKKIICPHCKKDIEVNVKL